MSLPINMVDLKGQYLKIKQEVDFAIEEVINQVNFINGPQVEKFSKDLELFLEVKHVIPVANGTDALQIAMMALDLKPGDEVILPVFTYVATAEVIALLGLKPIFVDVYPDSFNLNIEEVEKKITIKTKAIVPVHLFGQCAEMERLLIIAKKFNLFIIEDAAQAIGADCIFTDGFKMKGGTIGAIGTTSFFPSKNLGCFGDGGALLTNNSELAKKAQGIANHGQKVKYYHEVVGVNSRLDTLQAAILIEKLKHLENYTSSRIAAANFYDHALKNIPGLEIPKRNKNSTHVFHQYTIQLPSNKRDEIKSKLSDAGIPSMIYYPVPLHKQNAYNRFNIGNETFPVAEKLSTQVLSLPMHTELNEEQLQYITSTLIKLL